MKKRDFFNKVLLRFLNTAIWIQVSFANQIVFFFFQTKIVLILIIEIISLKKSILNSLQIKFCYFNRQLVFQVLPLSGINTLNLITLIISIKMQVTK